MSVKDKKEIISEILEGLFRKEENISFYFMKKVKNSSKNEAIIPYKTRKDVDLVKINQLEKTLQKQTGEADLKLIRWSEVIGKLVPASRVFRIPFFDSRDIEIKAHLTSREFSYHYQDLIYIASFSQSGATVSGTGALFPRL